MTEDDKVIVIGASAGGIEAVRTIARGLPSDLTAAVLIVVHTAREGPYLLPRILQGAGVLGVVHDVDRAPLERGHFYIAPPDHHLFVQGGLVRLSKGPKENRSRPAIDPLFRSAAIAYGPRVIGVVLTGMLDDGTAGLAAIKERGGVTIVQDPDDAPYPGMPTSALRHVAPDHVAPLAALAPLLVRVARKPRPAASAGSVSPRDAIETKLLQMELLELEAMNKIGNPAGLSCPECHGPMWAMNDNSVRRYRCHVGHAYTAESMLDGQHDAEESLMWQLLRMMKERASLLWEMRSHAQHEQRADDVVHYDARVRQLQHNIAAIQQLLEQDDPPASGG